MKTLRLRMVVLGFGVIACLMMAGGWAKGSVEPSDPGTQVLAAGMESPADAAAVAGAEGPRGRKSRKPAAKATITLDGQDYVISLIPLRAGGRKKNAAGGDAGGKRKKGKKAAGKGGGKGRGGAVVTVAGKKYRVRVVPADRAGKKDDRPKADKKGRRRGKGKGKAGKRKKR